MDPYSEASLRGILALLKRLLNENIYCLLNLGLLIYVNMANGLLFALEYFEMWLHW